MKGYHLVGISLIIGAIWAVSSISYQEAHATDNDEVMIKMIEAYSKLSNLKNTDSNFDELTMGKISFKIKQIQDSLLEINEVNARYDDNVNKMYEYLKINYSTELEKYQKHVKDYQKENGLTIQEKELVTDLLRSKIKFENNESQQNYKKTQQELINTTIKETTSKKDYQKLINQIGIKLANEGNELKIHHKLAINEIISSESWELAIPAIDRIITQTNSDEMKDRLIKVKKDIKEILDKKEKQRKQNHIMKLNAENVKGINLIKFNQKVVENPFVLDQIFEDEIIKSLTNSEEIFFEFEEELEQSLESNIEVSNTLNVIEVIFEDELIQSLEEVGEISDKDDAELEEKREKQREDAKEKKGGNKSANAKESLKDKENKKDKKDKPAKKPKAL